MNCHCWSYSVCNEWGTRYAKWSESSLVIQMVKNPPAMQEMRVWSLSQEDPLEEKMAIHSSILVWRVPWTEEPGGLHSPCCCIESDTTEGLSTANSPYILPCFYSAEFKRTIVDMFLQKSCPNLCYPSGFCSKWVRACPERYLNLSKEAIWLLHHVTKSPGAADAGTFPTAMRTSSETLWSRGNVITLMTFCIRRKKEFIIVLALHNHSSLTFIDLYQMYYKHYLESKSLIFFSELQILAKEHLKLSA